MSHKYIEVDRRFVEGRYGAKVVEVLYGCSCDKFGDVMVGTNLRVARAMGRAAVREHATVADLSRAQAYRTMVSLPG